MSRGTSWVSRDVSDVRRSSRPLIVDEVSASMTADALAATATRWTDVTHPLTPAVIDVISVIRHVTRHT